MKASNPENGTNTEKQHHRVSIGLPVYNGEKYISRTLDSLLDQSFQDFEIIIVDNASTDRTAEIVGSYTERDARIQYHRNETNKGASHNFNLALELAGGEYFKWMAADDTIQASFLSCCIEIMDRDPDIILAYSKAAFIDENDLVFYYFDDVMQLEPWSDKLARQASQMLNAVLRDPRAANVIIFGLAKTNALRTIPPLGNYFGCDIVAVTELSMVGRIVEIPAVLSFYRRHRDSSSGYKRTPSATKQQQFYDPTIRSRLKSEFQLRRRYFELVRSVTRSPLKTPERLFLLSNFFILILRRIGWRLGFEIRVASGQSVDQLVIKQTDGIGQHWSEI